MGRWWKEEVLIKRLSAPPPQAHRLASAGRGQMADGRPRQCYREMMIRLQGLDGGERPERHAVSPLIIITARKWIYAMPLAVKWGWAAFAGSLSSDRRR